MSINKSYGLTTQQAFNELHFSIKKELENCDCHLHQSSWFCSSWFREAFHHDSEHSTFRWTSILLLAIEAIVFILCYAIGDTFRKDYLLIESFFLLFLLLMNVTMVCWDNMLRHKEMHYKAETLLKCIEDCSKYADDSSEQYPHLHMPQSPCISLQWTQRNGKIVNLPCHFLVKDDIIILRPGHFAPGKCQCIEENMDSLELAQGDIFAPLANKKKESFTTVRLWAPVKPAKFVMLETPYINSLRYALQCALKRPPTLLNRERHMVVSYYLERIIIPILMVLTICIGIFHSIYLAPEQSSWSELIILRPALTILPLLSLALPLYWLLLNVCGMARLLLLVQLYKAEQKPLDPFEELEESSPTIPVQTINWRDIKYYFTDLLFGKKGYLWRSANVMQVLGSITALCCVDKKGILSWPNPTAEKVFFLKSTQNKTDSEDNAYFSTPSVDIDEAITREDFKTEDKYHDCQHHSTKFDKNKDSQDHIYHPESQVEVLDLTHSINGPFGLQFDEPKWKKYLSNLKPLGLSILLNTCNPSSQEHYSQFCDHIACESLHNDAAVPVVNKRCLCELAKLIGFTDQAVDGYDFKHHLALFRHVRPELIQKGRLAKSLNFPRLKMPFPTMSCAVIKDIPRGSFQLFSQGTADLLLDVCSEYWDGQDLCSLTESDRKRILDFYHRSSLTAYCMAFAYGPFELCSDDQFFDKYMELSSDSSHLFHSSKSGSVRSWDRQSLEGKSKTILSRHLSTDSILLKTYEDDDGSLHIENCLQQISNEIFIGMVTMQYQACRDFVQLIEQLDKACIRFVHFSKENELRSRVFSEKMGLESGWNCHISLLGEGTRSENDGSTNQQISSQTKSRIAGLHYKVASSETIQEISNDYIGAKPIRCVSAPSLINLDITTVKFEDEISMYSKSEDSISDTHSATSRDQMLPQCISEHSPKLISSAMTNKKLLSLEMSHQLEDKYSIDDEPEGNLSHSPSHVTESTEQSAPVTFDMSNRAKLPKGIENIRPHIKNVDNVPLLVSLFTDCTPETTKEMICIMQENGEVVCCLGSSANCSNIAVFLQADASIAIEPLYPQLCMQQPSFETVPIPDKPRLIELSQQMNSLPCAMTFHREDPVSMYHLIMEARHFSGNMRTCLQFMLCCCLSLTLLQLLSMLLFLPTPLPSAHMLWLICLEIPLLSLSLLGNPVDCQVMTVATGKNLEVVSKETILVFIGCYCAKFCPSVIVSISCFACMVAHFCNQPNNYAPAPCWIFHSSNDKTEDTNNWPSSLTVSQNIVALLLILYFETISMGFVQRSYLIWKRSPLTNKCWLAIIPIILLLQVIFSIIDISLNSESPEICINILKEVPYYVWIIGLLWPLLLIPINMLVKRHEIKVNVRQQKKARLEFGTKLGMNSPF